MVWYPFLRTYVSSLPGGGFIAIKVPPTHLKLLGVSSSEEKPCSTSNCAAGVVGNLMQFFLKFSELSWLTKSSDIFKDCYSTVKVFIYCYVKDEQNYFKQLRKLNNA